MALSLAEANYEYAQDEIKRLTDEIEKCELTIKNNKERIEFLEDQQKITAKNLVLEHPAIEHELRPEVKAALEGKEDKDGKKPKRRKRRTKAQKEEDEQTKKVKKEDRMRQSKAVKPEAEQESIKNVKA